MILRQMCIKNTFVILNEFILDKKDDKNVFRFKI